MNKLTRTSKDNGRATCEAMTIRYGFHPTQLGECFIAVTGRGICHLSFVDKAARAEVLQRFSREWAGAKFIADQKGTAKQAGSILGQPRSQEAKAMATLLCRGTDFQIKVWEALLKIPPGAVVSYHDLARSIRRPRAVRAVANAIGRNPVACLIPCHRVIRSAGQLGGYRWGVARKRIMLGMEAAA